MKENDIIILGAGLTGLTLAHLLHEKSIPCTLLDARDRVGGRIFTDYQKGEASIELGATWLGRNHPHLIELIQSLSLSLFPQELGATALYEPISTSPPQQVALPPQEEPSFRIAGGTSSLIRALAEKLPENSIRLGEKVTRIGLRDNHIAVHSTHTAYEGKYVISTLPPHLLISTIQFAPLLPDQLIQIAHKTHTWMGESIKVGLRYRQPFWKAAPYTGTVFSSVGPLTELYDHSHKEGTYYALKGFLNSAYHVASQEERIQAVQNQLNRYFPSELPSFSSYVECVWRKESFTFHPYEAHVLPHQNNGNPIYRENFYGGRLLLAGAETSPKNPGYMEGAVLSAKLSFEKLVAML